MQVMQLCLCMLMLNMLITVHELAHSGMGAVHVLLQHGLQFNSGMTRMWHKYICLKLRFIEALHWWWMCSAWH